MTDYEQIECSVDLGDAEAGSYGLTVTTDNGEGTLASAFAITAPPDGDDDDDDATGGDDDDDDSGCCG